MPKSTKLALQRYGILVAACLILALQASGSRMLKIDEEKIGNPGLHSLPWQLGTWKTTAEDSIGADVTAYLKPDEYILRNYVDESNQTPINLFVAYFKSLQNSYGPHSPSICLPGSGWLVNSSTVMNIPVPGRSEGIPANVFTMEKGNAQILVVYWYQNDRNVWAREFQAKLRLLPDLIRYRRSDVSLVRLVMPVRNSPKAELAEAIKFTERAFPLLTERFASVRTQ